MEQVNTNNENGASDSSDTTISIAVSEQGLIVIKLDKGVTSVSLRPFKMIEFANALITASLKVHFDILRLHAEEKEKAKKRLIIE